MVRKNVSADVVKIGSPDVSAELDPGGRLTPEVVKLPRPDLGFTNDVDLITACAGDLNKSLSEKLNEGIRFLLENRNRVAEVQAVPFKMLAKDMELAREFLRQGSLRNLIESDKHLNKEIAILRGFLYNTQDYLGFIAGYLKGADSSQGQLSVSVDERLSRLESYAKQFSGEGVAEYARLLFPELSANARQGDASLVPAALPTSAPATWKADKQPGETPPDFIKRVYGPWLGNGLTKAALRHLDEPLYRSLYKWLSNPKNELPADLDLPTKAEGISRRIDELRSESPDAGFAKVMGDFTLREAERIRSAIRRRERGKQ